MTATHLMPRRLVPDLSVPLVGGPKWRLRDQKPQHFTMLIFYRGHTHRQGTRRRFYVLPAQPWLGDLVRQRASVGMSAYDDGCGTTGVARTLGTLRPTPLARKGLRRAARCRRGRGPA